MDWHTRLCREAIPDKGEQIRLGRLIRRWQDWEGGPDAAPEKVRKQGKRALDRLVSGNARLAVSLARKVHPGRMELDDLIQVGLEGLINGCLRFDPSRGYALSTYARWWVLQALLRGRQHENPIYVNVETLGISAKANELIAAFEGAHNRRPSMEEVAAAMGNKYSAKRIRTCMEQVQRAQCASLDAMFGDHGDLSMAEGRVMADGSPQPLERQIGIERIERVRAALEGFSEAEQQVLWSATEEGPPLRVLMAERNAPQHRLLAERKALRSKARMQLRDLELAA